MRVLGLKNMQRKMDIVFKEYRTIKLYKHNCYKSTAQSISTIYLRVNYVDGIILKGDYDYKDYSYIVC